MSPANEREIPDSTTLGKVGREALLASLLALRPCGSPVCKRRPCVQGLPDITQRTVVGALRVPTDASSRLAIRELISNSPSLIVLPCSGGLRGIIAGCLDSFCFAVLLLSADVKVNPGPPTNEQLAAILENRSVSSRELESIREK